MRIPLTLALLLAAAPLQAQGPAADTTPAPLSEDSIAKLTAAFESGLHYQAGTVQISGGIATLTLPASLRFLDRKDAKHLLVDAWGNPEDAVDGVLGMILPAELSPLSAEGWGIIVSFEEQGYVNDSGAASIDYNALLATMREGLAEENKARKDAGYDQVELVGWAEPPHYDSAAHKLYWAKELAFSGSDHHTLNYNIRILGRRGVLVLNAVGSMDQLELIHQATPEVLAAVEFNEGHRYADFTEGDKVAAYGIGGLILGGIATKAGFFKVIWVAILALKKFIVLGFVAVAGWFKSRFGKKKEEVAVEAPPAT